jgi:hypothetical protein
MENGELIILPGAARCGDEVCILSGADSPCTLRTDGDGGWGLVSGDCPILTKHFQSPGNPWFFMCDEYVMYNQSEAKDFILR